jgi:hypothetical protein
MTAYFDKRSSEVRDLLLALRADGETPAILEAIDDLDEMVLADVTKCAEWPAKGARPACPEDIRLAIHRTVLLYSTQAQVFSVAAKWVCPDYADTEARLQGLDTMISRLHGIFHELGRRGLAGFNDSPRTPLLVLDDDGEAAREKLTAEMKRTTRRATTTAAGNPTTEQADEHQIDELLNSSASKLTVAERFAALLAEGRELQVHVVGNALLIPYSDAAELLRQAAAEGRIRLRTYAYHGCSEAPVEVLEGDGARVPRNWVCPECERDDATPSGYGLVAVPVTKGLSR